MQDGVETVGRDLVYLCGEVLRAVHDVGGTELAYMVGLRAGGRGRDDRRATRPGELQDERANAAGGAGHEHRFPVLDGHRVERAHGGRTGQAERAGRRMIDIGGYRSDVVPLRDDEVLAEGARVQGLGQHHTEDLGARGELVHALPDPVHRAGEVPAQDHREAMFHQVFEIAAGECEVEPGQRRGTDLHPDLTRPVPGLLVVNKVDAAEAETLLRLKRLWPDAVFVSARTGTGLAELRAEVEARLPGPAVELWARVPYERGDLVARVHARGEVRSCEHTAEGTVVHARVDEALAAELAPYAMTTVPPTR